MSKTIIGIDLGHNDKHDVGAAGLDKTEDQLIMEIGGILIPKLEKDHEVIVCKPQNTRSLNDSLLQRSAIANRAKCKVFYSIHLNAFNRRAHGSETFAMSSAGRELAQSVLDEILKLGFRNRGVKDGRRFSVVRRTAMPAVLIECCFCDSKQDMDNFSAEAMADAIYNGIINSL